MPNVKQQVSNLPECISGSLKIKSPFLLTFGQTLNNAAVSYSIYGELTKPAIVVLGGISADQYVADTDVEGMFVQGWWDPLVGFNKAINLSKYCVISINYMDGQTDKRASASDQPINISTFDQASVIHQLIDCLGIEKLYAIIGSSYGGMVAQAFAQSYPTQVEQIISICAFNKSDSRNTALRNLQRNILRFAINNGDPREGLILARSIATLGYRGANELDQRFPNNININAQTAEFPIVSYLQNQGEKFADRFCPQRFINLSLSIDLHQISPEKITAKCLLIGIEGDLIAPPDKVNGLAQQIGSNATFSLLKSNVGHDGFLKEFGQISKLIQSRLGK